MSKTNNLHILFYEEAVCKKGYKNNEHKSLTFL